jgi:hypothetical protein
MHDARKPLPNSRHESFARAIAQGHRLGPAYERAGFAGKSRRLSWELRHRPEVDARIAWLLGERVKADTRAYRRREKQHGDLLDRAIRELEAIAFHDIREVADWRREPKMGTDGEVIGTDSSLVIRDAADLPACASKAIKSVFLKGGALRIDMCDKRQALVDIIKLLTGSDAAQPSKVAVTQVNIGAVDAREAAKRVSFLLAAARAREPALKTIDVSRALPNKDSDKAE